MPILKKFQIIIIIIITVSFCITLHTFSSFLKILKSNSLINVGSGQEFQIKKFAEIINKLTFSNKKLRFNKKFPDGTKRKILDDFMCFFIQYLFGFIVFSRFLVRTRNQTNPAHVFWKKNRTKKRFQKKRVKIMRFKLFWSCKILLRTSSRNLNI